MASQRAGFSAILAPGIHKVIKENTDFKQYPDEYKMFFNMEGSKRQFEEQVVMTGFGSMPEKKEREETIFDDPIQGTVKRYTHLTYSLGFRVSLELWEDELYGTIKAMPKELAFSANDVVEVTAAGIVINGFTDTAANQGPDGDPLFGDGVTRDHAMLGGGRWSNQLSTPADLSADALELMINLIADTTNERGLLIRLIPKLLIIPQELWVVAKELLESEQKAHTANNEANPFKDLDLKWSIWHYLTDPDAWFIQAQLHYMNFFWRQKNQFKNDDDFFTDDALFKLRQRFDVDWTSGRGIAGSPGA